jgi:carbamoyl-phosphate synthase large subunit
LKNDITRETPASFEPTIDYVVTKIPRFTFEKFPGADETLTTQMKSVGEAMAIGRTFKESLQKACAASRSNASASSAMAPTRKSMTRPSPPSSPCPMPSGFSSSARLSPKAGMWRKCSLTKIDRWFLRQIEEIVKEQQTLATLDLRKAKRLGFSDRQIAQSHLAHGNYKTYSEAEAATRTASKAAGIIPTYRLVDTCAAEFEASRPTTTPPTASRTRCATTTARKS